MEEIQGHLGSDVFYDFEEMSCGDLLIALLKAMRPLPAGTLIEVWALDPGAPIDIPAGCRMVGHVLLVRAGGPEHTLPHTEGRVIPMAKLLISITNAKNDTDRATVWWPTPQLPLGSKLWSS